MELRDKRDLPEVVAEILIEQHAMRQDIGEMRQDIGEMRQDINGLRQEMKAEIGGLRQDLKVEIGGLRQEMRAGQESMVQLFNSMTNAILDAMNRNTDRYDSTNQEVDKLKVRVTSLENPAA